MGFNRCSFCGVRSKLEKCLCCEAIGIESPLPIGIRMKAPDFSEMNKQFRQFCYTKVVFVSLCKDAIDCSQSYYVSRYREKDFYSIPRKAGVGVTVKVQSQLLVMSANKWAKIMKAGLLLRHSSIQLGDCFLFANHDSMLLEGITNYLSIVGFNVVRIVNGYEWTVFNSD